MTERSCSQYLHHLWEVSASTVSVRIGELTPDDLVFNTPSHDTVLGPALVCFRSLKCEWQGKTAKGQIILKISVDERKKGITISLRCNSQWMVFGTSQSLTIKLCTPDHRAGAAHAAYLKDWLIYVSECPRKSFLSPTASICSCTEMILDIGAFVCQSTCFQEPNSCCRACVWLPTEAFVHSVQQLLWSAKWLIAEYLLRPLCIGLYCRSSTQLFVKSIFFGCLL